MYGFSKNRTLCLCSHGKIWGEGGAKVVAGCFLGRVQELGKEGREEAQQVTNVPGRAEGTKCVVAGLAELG